MTRHHERPLVFLAATHGKITTADELVTSTRAAVHIGRTLESYYGVTAFVPDAMLAASLISPVSAEDFTDWRRAMILRCDALFRVKDVRSDLLDGEVRWAQRHDIAAFDEMDRLAKWVEEWQLTARYELRRLLHLAADRIEELMPPFTEGSRELAAEVRKRGGDRPPAPPVEEPGAIGPLAAAGAGPVPWWTRS